MAKSASVKNLVVVGTDFTEGARSALGRAAMIAKSTGSRLLVVHVVPEMAVVPIAPLPGEWGGTSAPATSEEGQAALLATARLAEQRLAREVGMPDAEAVIRTGRPHEALAHVAERRGARLLVVGVHAAMDPGETFFLGSTAERLLRAGSTPVLISRRPADKPYGRILVPVDVGEMSLALLRLVAATFPDAEYDVCHFLAPTTSKAVTANERRDAHAAALQGFAIEAGLDPKRTRVRVFPTQPREGIAGEIKARKPDLVAMGTHARSGLARVFIGSVADYVIHAATIDVLVVPPAAGT